MSDSDSDSDSNSNSNSTRETSEDESEEDSSGSDSSSEEGSGSSDSSDSDSESDDSSGDEEEDERNAQGTTKNKNKNKKNEEESAPGQSLASYLNQMPVTSDHFRIIIEVKRGRIVRSEIEILDPLELRHKAAARIQRCWRAFHRRRKLHDLAYRSGRIRDGSMQTSPRKEDSPSYPRPTSPEGLPHRSSSPIAKAIQNARDYEREKRSNKPNSLMDIGVETSPRLSSPVRSPSRRDRSMDTSTNPVSFQIDHRSEADQEIDSLKKIGPPSTEAAGNRFEAPPFAGSRDDLVDEAASTLLQPSLTQSTSASSAMPSSSVRREPWAASYDPPNAPPSLRSEQRNPDEMILRETYFHKIAKIDRARRLAEEEFDRKLRERGGEYAWDRAVEDLNSGLPPRASSRQTLFQE